MTAWSAGRRESWCRQEPSFRSNDVIRSRRKWKVWCHACEIFDHVTASTAIRQSATTIGEMEATLSCGLDVSHQHVVEVFFRHSVTKNASWMKVRIWGCWVRICICYDYSNIAMCSIILLWLGDIHFDLSLTRRGSQTRSRLQSCSTLLSKLSHSSHFHSWRGCTELSTSFNWT